MRIGIDCRTLVNMGVGKATGVNHYTYYLIKHLLRADQENHYFLFVYYSDLETKEFEQSNVTIVRMPWFKYKKFLPYIYSHIISAVIFYWYRLDLLHFPAPYLALGYFGKTVSTIHDLAVYKNPQWFPQMNPFFTKIIIPMSLRRSKKVIAVSQSTKSELQQYFNIPLSKINVVSEGVEDFRQFHINLEKVRSEVLALQNYLVFVGTIEPRKNIDNIILGYKRFIMNNPESAVKLVLGGKMGWKYENIKKLMDDPQLVGKLIYLGYITLDEKIYLIKHALALVYPSHYEGFGLPLLEAMILETPVLTSNVGAISEVVLDSALLVNPDSVDEIGNGMSKICCDEVLRQKLVKRSVIMASAYSWEKCAQRTIEVYQKAVQDN